MSRLLFSLGMALIVLVANLAAADELFKSIYIEDARTQLATLTTNCPNARVLHSITNLPTEIRERLSGTADAGEPFSPGCIRKYAGQRFLTATRIDNTYIIAIEHGGIVYNWSILGFIVDNAGKIIREMETAGPTSRDQPASPGTNQSPPAVGPAHQPPH